MLAPKKVKYRNKHKGRMEGIAWRGSKISFGTYALQALDPGLITDRQIEASRVAIARHIKRGGKIWIRIFPDKPVTKKPLEVRMGKGKGGMEGWVARVKQGRILFEMDGVTPEVAKEALQLAQQKLGIRTRILNKHERGALA